VSEIDAARDWLTGTSSSQFLLGVLVLVFGTQKILSAENVQSSLGGLLLPVKWLHNRRKRAAEEKVAEVAAAKRERVAVEREIQRYHAWAMMTTKRVRELESVIAAHGIDLPPPPFVYLHEFQLPSEARPDEEDDSDDDAEGE